jgi:hypothetical protein
MKKFLKLVGKYAIILVITNVLLNSVFFLNLTVFPFNTHADANLWGFFSSYIGYVVNVIIAVLLFVDTKKYQLNFTLIPLVGLFYPLLGISVFLILLIYKENLSINNSTN